MSPKRKIKNKLDFINNTKQSKVNLLKSPQRQKSKTKINK